MASYILFVAGALLLGCIIGFISIPYILDFCRQKALYDIPNSRKVHKNAIPRLGGIVFLPGMLLSFVIAVMTMSEVDGEQKISISLRSVSFLVSLMLIYITGITDDILGLSARTKFIIQTVAACLLPMSGLYINNMYGLFGIYEIPFAVGFPLTVLTIVFIDNAMNLIDGIDGLSAGLSIIALTGFLFAFANIGLWTYAVLIAGLIGIIIPFLYYNIFGDAEKNKKIFMGDSGSLTLGFILSFLLVKYSMDNPAVLPYRDNSLIFAPSLLIVPTFDVFRVMLHRVRNHKSIFAADKKHIHHKLMRAGMSQHKALCVILALAVMFIVVNNILAFAGFTTVIIIDILSYTAFHLVLNRMIFKHIKKGHAG